MRKILLSGAKIFLTAALLYFALRNTSFNALSSRFSRASLIWVALVLVVALLQIFASALRWRQIVSVCGAVLLTKQAFRFNLIGAFFNQTLPSSIGGDAVRLWLVGRGSAGWRVAAYSVFVDRAIGLLALAIMIAATLPWSYKLIDNAQGRTALLIVVSMALVGGLGFLVISRVQFTGLRRLHFLHHIHACSVIANAALFNRKGGPRLVALSLLIHVLSVVLAWCVAQSIAAPVSFEQMFELIPPVLLITMLPVSIGGWGLRETTMGLAFGYAGLATTEGVNISLLYGASLFVIGALGGLVWVFSAEKSAKAAEKLAPSV